MSTQIPEAGPPPPRLPAHIFLSYASEDREQVRKLYEALINAGAASVWWDRPKIDPGEEWKKELQRGLLRTDLLLAILTPASVDKKSYWIDWEHSEAARLLRPIIPVRLANCDPPAHLAKLQYVDLSVDWERGFTALLNAIGKLTLRVGLTDAKFADETPPVLRPFIGREQEIQELFELLEQNAREVATGRRSVAVQGMGGSGKTMLAEELVRRLAVHYPGGVAVERRGEAKRAAAEEVLQRWAKCILGDYPEPPWSIVDIRSELHLKFGELLLLLDDVSEDDFDDVESLLRALPPDATRLLTTRYETISTLGCLIYPLGDFVLEDALEMLRDRLANKGPEPSEEVATRLFQAVGGHALSLELAAGRCQHTRDFPKQVDKLVQRLREGRIDRLATRALRARGRGQDAKNDSVAASLSESLESLEEADREHESQWARRFRALGVLPEHARIDEGILAALWGDRDPDADAVEDALGGLSARAMLNRDMNTGHYVSHPVLRAYALEHLRQRPEELGVVRERYIRLVSERSRVGFAAPPEEWGRMEIYRPHIFQVSSDLLGSFEAAFGQIEPHSRPEIGGRAIPGTQEAQRAELESALEFARSVRPFVVQRPETSKRGLACLRLGLAAANLLGRDHCRIDTLQALGHWYGKRDPKKAAPYYEAGITISQDLGDRAAEASLLTHMGELRRTVDKPDEALELLQRALEAHQELGDRQLEAMTLRSLGETHWRTGNHQRAWDLHHRALKIYRDEGNRSGEGDMLNKIGSVYFNRGEKEKAISRFREALEIHREVGDRSMEAEDLNDMGISYTYLGDLTEALPLLIDGLLIHRELGSRRLQAVTMCNIASVYLQQELFEAAAAIAQDALKITREVESLVVESWALSRRGQALQRLGQPGQSVELFNAAIDAARRAGNNRGLAGHLGFLGALYLECGEPAKALKPLREAANIMRRKGLTEAYGGRTPRGFSWLIDEAEQATESAS